MLHFAPSIYAFHDPPSLAEQRESANKLCVELFNTSDVIAIVHQPEKNRISGMSKDSDNRWNIGEYVILEVLASREDYASLSKRFGKPRADNDIGSILILDQGSSGHNGPTAYRPMLWARASYIVFLNYYDSETDHYQALDKLIIVNMDDDSKDPIDPMKHRGLAGRSAFAVPHGPNGAFRIGSGPYQKRSGWSEENQAYSEYSQRRQSEVTFNVDDADDAAPVIKHALRLFAKSSQSSRNQILSEFSKSNSPLLNMLAKRYAGNTGEDLGHFSYIADVTSSHTRAQADNTPYARALKKIRKTKESKRTILDLSDMGLTSVPPEIGDLINLTGLYLNDNKLTLLPPEIGTLTKLTNLNLENNQLTALPPEIGKFTDLTYLSVSNNQLAALPPEIGALVKLDRLYLINNHITWLPPDIGLLASLKWLRLSKNQLTSLPAEIGLLANLDWLILENNQLTSLPPEISGLSSVTTLDVGSNLLPALPAEIGKLSSLIHLRLINNKLTSLPAEIGQLDKLEALNLQANQITALPKEIGNLSSLTILNLYNNQLTTIPPEIGQLDKLEDLGLSKNKIESLPPEIGDLTYLDRLNLSDNKLTSLPPQIGKLHVENRWLYLRDNPLKDPPLEIAKDGINAMRTYFEEQGYTMTSAEEDYAVALKKIRSAKKSGVIELDLRNHRLTALPPEIGELTELRRLYLNNNKLTALPPEIGKLKDIYRIMISGNPMESPPLATAEKGILAIRKYFEEQGHVYPPHDQIK